MSNPDLGREKLVEEFAIRVFPKLPPKSAKLATDLCAGLLEGVTIASDFIGGKSVRAERIKFVCALILEARDKLADCPNAFQSADLGLAIALSSSLSQKVPSRSINAAKLINAANCLNLFKHLAPDFQTTEGCERLLKLFAAVFSENGRRDSEATQKLLEKIHLGMSSARDNTQAVNEPLVYCTRLMSESWVPRRVFFGLMDIISMGLAADLCDVIDVRPAAERLNSNVPFSNPAWCSAALCAAIDNCAQIDKPVKLAKLKAVLNLISADEIHDYYQQYESWFQQNV